LTRSFRLRYKTRLGLKRLLRNLNLANQLTFLRLVAAPFLVLAILRGRFDLALGIFGAAASRTCSTADRAALPRGNLARGYLDPARGQDPGHRGLLLLTEYQSLFRSIPMTVGSRSG
jgi:hypothetical protein